MLFIMGVQIYTSRVILDKLGISDYGLYNVVGGIVGMLTFLNGTLTIGTSRFITYELGRGDFERLRRTFITAFYAHLALSAIVVVIMETGGLWFLYNKLAIPLERLDACFWVFQISILTTFVSITQVPYGSLVTSHERFNIYAVVGIFEAAAKLGVCFVLVLSPIDRLVFYAILLAVVQIAIALFYRFYCMANFKEAHLALSFDNYIFKGLLSFSGWNIVANLTETLKLQGVLILINIFLSPVVVASQALANQVSTALMQFVNNFRIAFNPQIIKLYAAGDKEASKRLTLETTVFCFDLILMLALPCIFCMKAIMGIWLVEVPDYAVLFTQCILVCNIIGTFGASFYIPMMAANKIKTNSMAAVVLGIGQFVLLYVVLECGGGPTWVPILSIVISVGFSLVVKPYVLWKDIDYSFKELFACYWACGKVLIISLLLSLPFKFLFPDSLLYSILLILITIIAVILSSWIFLGKEMKEKTILLVKKKIFSK